MSSVRGPEQVGDGRAATAPASRTAVARRNFGNMASGFWKGVGGPRRSASAFNSFMTETFGFFPQISVPIGGFSPPVDDNLSFKVPTRFRLVNSVPETNTTIEKR
jgi:hypothetical protein